MLSLDVTIDTKSGFCFGVEFAIEMAEDILKEEGELYCLGDIVHNNREVTRLEKMGLEIIDLEKLKVMKDVKVLIRAHGEPPSTYEIAIKNNITLIDASCPVVLKLQNRIKKSHDKEEKIYIYGISTDNEERKEVVNEAKKILDVEDVIASILLLEDLSRKNN